MTGAVRDPPGKSGGSPRDDEGEEEEGDYLQDIPRMQALLSFLFYEWESQGLGRIKGL